MRPLRILPALTSDWLVATWSFPLGHCESITLGPLQQSGSGLLNQNKPIFHRFPDLCPVSFAVHSGYSQRGILGPDDELLNMRVIPAYTGRPNMLPVLACGANWFPPHPAPCQVIRKHCLRTSYAKLFIYISSLKPRYISEIATMFPHVKDEETEA